MPRQPVGSGASWKDVEDALLHLQSEGQVYAHLEFHTAGLGVLKKSGLVVSVTVVRVEGAGGRGGQRTFRRQWPSYHVRTMPAMVLALIHEAHESLASRPIAVGKQLKVGPYPAG